MLTCVLVSGQQFGWIVVQDLRRTACMLAPVAFIGVMMHLKEIYTSRQPLLQF